MEMDQQSQGSFPEIWAVGGAMAVMGGGVGERDGSAEESSLTDQSGGSGGRRRMREVRASVSSAQEELSQKMSTASGGNKSIGCDIKRLKIEATKDDNMDSNAGRRTNNHAKTKNLSTQPPPKQDYIHVRARRGQATDSHSLAERARREKISERMKILQDLVPGCNKVIGKALVLDEIINYIQSLQRQVEFLSMKLEAINSGMNLVGFEGFPAKNFCMQTFEAVPGQTLTSQPSRDYAPGPSSEWLHMQVGGGFERAT